MRTTRVIRTRDDSEIYYYYFSSSFYCCTHTRVTHTRAAIEFAGAYIILVL